jgi:hypothetical protein
MFKRIFSRQLVKINKKLFFVFIGCVLTFALIVPAGATFYEVNGMIKWENQPLRNVDVYLVLDSADFVRECNNGKKITLEVAPGNFYDSYLSLSQKNKEIRISGDERDRKKQTAKTVNDFKKLIKMYMLRKVIVDKEGGVYLNISPERIYYLVVLKKNKLFEKNKGFAFWIEKLYFKAGNVLQPKEIQLNELNVTLWQ